MRKVILLSFLSVLCTAFAFAQDRTVTGNVTSQDDASTLPGVSVLLKGTTTGTVTDIDGNYKISVPSDGGTLVFSFIGFASTEVEIGSQSTINIALTTDVTELSEVVVTALGVSREKASLGYGVSTIGGDLVEKRAEADIGRILRGKAPGVDITQTSGMTGTGTNIIIRGYSSITGSNQPLFVVDGIPFNSSTSADRGFVAGGATASSRFLDLDPNNIAEISVLKGLAATGLYGEAGRNGVVLITTKTGASRRSEKGSEITFSQSVSMVEVANIPDYQDSYGNGFSGNFGWFFSNWGPHFDVRGSNGIDANGQIAHPYDQGQYNEAFPEFIGQRYDYAPYQSVENFFQRGVVSNTSVGLNKNVGDAGSVSFNYSYLDDKGFIPENKNRYQRHNFALGGNTKLDNGIVLNTSFKYADTKRLSPPAAAGAGSNPSGASLFANLIYTPRSIDLLNLPYQSPVDGSMVYYRRGAAIQNPLWTLNNAVDNEAVIRYTGNINASYEINDNIRVDYQIGVDQYSQTQQRTVNRGGSQLPDGYMESSTRVNRIQDHLARVFFNYDLTSDLNLSGLAGVNLRREEGEITGVESSNQFVFDLFNQANFKVHNGYSGRGEENTIGAYVQASLGFRDYAYLNIQGRNDWTSTLEKANRSILYPSVSASFVASEAIPALADNDFVNLLKIRVGYGTSAGYPGAYSTRNVLNTGANAWLNGSTIVDINSVSNRLGNPNLKPELHTETEIGIEASLWESRLGVDLSLYDKGSDDLIIGLSLDPSTGYTSTTVNAANVTNRGIELGLNLVPVRTGDFTWDIQANWTKNVNDVVGIYPGVDQINISGSFDGIANWAIPGERFGVFQGSSYTREGDQRVVGGDGNYIVKSGTGIVGDPNPDWSGNVTNTLSWKGLSFSMLWSYVSGGDIYSLTTATMLARGNTVDTDFDRFLPVVLPGVKEDENGNFVPNDIQGYIGDISFRAYFWANEGGIFDGTRLRLQEVSLAYEIPANILEKTPFGSANISFHGQNLWYKSFNFPEGVNYDADVVSTGVGNGRGLEFITGPTSKRYGATLSLSF